MKKLFHQLKLRRLQEDEAGLTTVEYALLLTLIAIVAIGAWTTLGENVEGKAQEAADALK